MSNEERSRILHRVQPLRQQLQQSLRGSLADHERLMRALHPLAEPPVGDGWNRSELIDLLPPGPPVEAAVLAGIVPRANGAQVILTRRTETLRTHGARSDSPAAAPSLTTATRWRPHCARARKKSHWRPARCRRWGISILS